MIFKKVLITGVSFGLGNYLLRRLITDGFTVIGIDRVFPESLSKEIDDKTLFFYKQDLTDIEGTIRLLERVNSEHNEIDVVINNAAILNFKFLTEDNYHEIIRKLTVNLTAPIVISKYFLEAMLKRDYGRIINISSASAFRGKETTSIYAVSKSGINRFHQVLYREMQMINKSGNLTLNTICPDRIALPEFLDENPEVKANKLIQPDKIYLIIKKIITGNVNGKIYVIPRFNWRRLIDEVQFIKRIPLLRRIKKL